MQILKLNEFINESTTFIRPPCPGCPIDDGNYRHPLEDEVVYYGFKMREGSYFMVFGTNKNLYINDDDVNPKYTQNGIEFSFTSNCANIVSYRLEDYAITYFGIEGLYIIDNIKTKEWITTIDELNSFIEKMQKTFPKWIKTTFKGKTDYNGNHWYSKTYYDVKFIKNRNTLVLALSDKQKMTRDDEMFSALRAEQFMKKLPYNLNHYNIENTFEILNKNGTQLKEADLQKVIDDINNEFPKWQKKNLLFI